MTADYRALTDEERASKVATLKRLERLRAAHLIRQPFTATLLLRMNLFATVDYRVTTACTDGQDIWVDAAWSDTLNDEELIGLLAHELWHAALNHLSRRMERNHSNWNIAVDAEVNALLLSEGFKLPKHTVPPVTDPPGLNAEEIYERLIARTLTLEGFPIDQHMEINGKFGQADSPLERNLERPIDSPLPMDPDYHPAPSRKKMSRWPAEVAAVFTELSLRGKGDIPGSIASVVESIMKPQVNWRAVLAEFVGECVPGQEEDWSRPNRRHVWQDAYLPGRTPEELLDIAVCIDTSGSTVEYFNSFASELRAIVDTYPAYRVVVVQCDAQVHSVVSYDQDNPMPSGEVQFFGMGGTDLQPALDAVLGLDIRPAAIVFFTDGFTSPVKDPGIRLLWVLTPDGRQPADFGRVVWMKK